MFSRIAASLVSCVVLTGAAAADIIASAPDGFHLQVKGEIALDDDLAWARLVQVGLWWPPSHTWSGSASAMYIDAVAGGCWCEVWPEGEVEHGRVIFAKPGETLRMAAALGPLQELGVSGVLTFALAPGPAADVTSITADFRVNGSSLSKLDEWAPLVNRVFNQQVSGFLDLSMIGAAQMENASPEGEAFQ